MTPSKLRVLIADDELLARKRLLRLLAEMDDVQALGACENADEVLERVKDGGIDLLLLDIHMPGLSGIDALRMLGEGAPAVVFCTAHADHAVEAFDGGAVDYLLKPIAPDRLKKAIDRVRARTAPTSVPPKAAPAQPDRLAVSTRQGIVLVDPKTITHAVLDGVLVTLGTTETEYVTDFSLQELEKKLPHLLRVHRRALVNLAHVSRLEPQETGGYLARTVRGHAVEVSRQSARELRKALGLRKAGDDDA
jgi:two-component system LytT family response regulator